MYICNKSLIFCIEIVLVFRNMVIHCTVSANKINMYGLNRTETALHFRYILGTSKTVLLHSTIYLQYTISVPKLYWYSRYMNFKVYVLSTHVWFSFSVSNQHWYFQSIIGKDKILLKLYNLTRVQFRNEILHKNMYVLLGYIDI